MGIMTIQKTIHRSKGVPLFDHFFLTQFRSPYQCGYSLNYIRWIHTYEHIPQGFGLALIHDGFKPPLREQQENSERPTCRSATDTKMKPFELDFIRCLRFCFCQEGLKGRLSVRTQRAIKMLINISNAVGTPEVKDNAVPAFATFKWRRQVVCSLIGERKRYWILLP